ncbi:unnamed protein product [Kuraishia capsulata CBS 1993]|uniref:Protein BIG1 n=1 Tax=Kuraishia capsulata CBS 1993 TaxID=1382522 RepID=W6MI51_9ASCO|nr:uncharacterized protein KUCA_T00001508001 [Kuraishia capsulata CBS 1993]CDK25538.1 unnamed protein product [Kuraishia capsulata CBS 1993]
MKMILLKLVIASVLLVTRIEAANTFPAFLFSHKLVPSLRANLPHSEQVPFTLAEATEIFNRLAEQCLSNAYIVVNQPGLTIQDLTNFQGYPFTRDMMTAASTIVTFPNVITEDSTTFNLDSIESHLKQSCHVKTHQVLYNDENEVPPYIDTRPRLIKVMLPALPEEEIPRTQALLDHDFLLKKIARKLPSPYITVLYTTDTVSEFKEGRSFEYSFEDIPDDPRMITTSQMKDALYSYDTIFPDITIFDKSRWFEYERNDMGELDNDLDSSVWAKDEGGRVDDTWLEKKTKEILTERKYTRFGENDDMLDSSIINKDLLLENAPLVFGIVLTVFALIAYNILRLILRCAVVVWRLGFKAKVNNEKKVQ